jgi:hypothetical protein
MSEVTLLFTPPVKTMWSVVACVKWPEAGSVEELQVW